MYNNVYSPLEQFEPVPLLTLFFGGVNFSVTNVSIIFMYIAFVVFFFLQGAMVKCCISDGARFITFVNSKGKISRKIVYSLSLNNIYKGAFFKEGYLNFFSNKIVSYLFYLENAYRKGVLNKSSKEVWLGLNVFLLPNLKTEYSREFHKIFFNLLKTNSIKLSGDFVLFNGVQLYATNFLNNLLIFKDKASVIRDRFNVEKIFSQTVNARPFGFDKNFIPFFNIYIFENLYNIILNMVKENIGGSVKKVIKFFPFIFTLFVFILIANLVGLIPYSSTVTSYLIVTFAMAIMVLVGVNIIAGQHHGLVYFGHFLPAGCPFALYPLIIPIEFISYIFRVVSLSVRLFANMMAGHTLLAVLAGFGWTMANASISLLVLSPLPILVVFILVFLETAVAIIQAYVFSILTCMYLDEAINLH